MRNLKKFLALVLATMMLLSVAVFSANAADEADYTDAANHLAALQVMKGNENGDLMLGNGVTRYQAALLFVQTLTGKTAVDIWNAEKQSAVFSDVTMYGTAIDYAAGLGIVKGRGNGIYGYNDPITYQDMLVMAVRALGYETIDMQYPYGHIIAAQKLGLTDDVDLVNYKAALTRGETAQIIWNMLQTEVAVVDPLTNKVLYPGETGLTDTITGTVVERTTLLVESGLAGAELVGEYVEFVPADDKDEDSFDIVKVKIGTDIFEIAAADLGITTDTAKVTYVGLPVEIFVSVNADKFTQDAYNDGEAKIVFANGIEYTTVQNLDDTGNIKYVSGDNAYLSIAGTKFKVTDYTFTTKVFVDGKWTANGTSVENVFAYDETAKSYTGTNTYGEVAYRVVSEPVKTNGVVTTGEVELLYTEYEFGQYNVREINEVTYTVIGIYEPTAYTNFDGETTNFVEYTVDGKVKVTNNTTKISGTKGEKAATVVVEGEAVNTGDFMFYAYNETDNILTVAMNCGTFQTGRLTAQNSTKETVKINGTNYEFGFAGNYACDFEAVYSADIAMTYMSALEVGKDNVQFIVVDGKIVYITKTNVISANSILDYAIVTLDAEIMAELLGMTTAKYEAALGETTGLYVENDEVKVAMLNLETGKWELVTIAAIASNWVAEDEEFEIVKNLSEAAKYTEIFNSDKYTNTINEFKALVNGVLVAIADVKKDVYTIAANEADFFVTGTADTNGIVFSNNSTATNKITADNDVDAARVTVDDETVIVIIDVVNGVAGTRTGIQAKNNSYAVTTGYFLAANSNLIVLVDTGAAEGATTVADWAEAATANADENWFIVTIDTAVEIESNEDETYTITYFNLYDMKAQAMVETLVTVVEDLDEAIEVSVADIIFKSATNELQFIAAEDVDFNAIIAEVANDNEDKLTYNALNGTIEFIDADTIKVVNGENVVVSDVEATKVNMTVVTLNMTTIDFAEYDFDAAVVFVEGDDADTTVKFGEDEKNANYFEIALDLINEINEPTEGVFDKNAFVDFAVPTTDSNDYADGAMFAIDVFAVYNYDNETGVLSVIVYKLLVNAQ